MFRLPADKSGLPGFKNPELYLGKQNIKTYPEIS